MDLISVLKLMVRRWYIAGPVIVATLIVAFVMQSNVPREYEARGTLLLSSPEFDPSRAPQVAVELADAVARLRGPEGLAEVEAGGGMEEYTIRQRDDLNAEVRVPGDSTAAATTARILMEQMGQAVVDRQARAGIPEEERVQPQTQVSVREIEQDPDAGDDARVDFPQADRVTIGSLNLVDPARARGNPFPAGDATSRVLQLAVHSDAGRLLVRERVAREELLDFEVVPQGGPGIIEIRLTTSDPQVALSAFDVVHEVLQDELDRRQARADVPVSRRLVLEVLGAPQAPVDVTGPVDRATAAIVGLGGLLAVGLVLLVENLTPAWRQRRTKRSGGDDHAVANTESTPLRPDLVGDTVGEGQGTWWGAGKGPIVDPEQVTSRTGEAERS